MGLCVVCTRLLSLLGSPSCRLPTPASAVVVSVQAIDNRPAINATLQVTGAVGWRREGLVYKKNEVQMYKRNLSFREALKSTISYHFLFN